jgi:hypothetical protein
MKVRKNCNANVPYRTKRSRSDWIQILNTDFKSIIDRMLFVFHYLCDCVNNSFCPVCAGQYLGQSTSSSRLFFFSNIISKTKIVHAQIRSNFTVYDQ